MDYLNADYGTQPFYYGIVGGGAGGQNGTAGTINGNGGDGGHAGNGGVSVSSQVGQIGTAYAEGEYTVLVGAGGAIDSAGASSSFKSTTSALRSSLGGTVNLSTAGAGGEYDASPDSNGQDGLYAGLNTATEISFISYALQRFGIGAPGLKYGYGGYGGGGGGGGAPNTGQADGGSGNFQQDGVSITGGNGGNGGVNPAPAAGGNGTNAGGNGPANSGFGGGGGGGGGGSVNSQPAGTAGNGSNGGSGIVAFYYRFEA